MTRAGLNRLSGVAPLLCSAIAFAIVIGNVIVGVPPQPDENASAHLWQLLMAVQLPMIAVFAVTADWRAGSTLRLLGFQLAGIACACLPVWLAGY